MHARQRSPGNGFRSSSMGMGMNLGASRTSPEGSIRGSHGFYASEYRHLNRDGGFGRGRSNPKSSFSHPPQPPSSRKGDIFMEAGRLAAEYLVNQGLLPPNVLSTKWHNSSFKKHTSGELREFRQQDEDTLQIPLEGRTSALARLGNTIPDTPSGRRKFGLDRRRGGSFRSNAYDWGREYKRSSSWSDRLGAPPDIKDDDEIDDDTVTRHHDEEEKQQVSTGVDNGLLKSNSNEFAPKREDGNDLDTGIDKDPGSTSSEMDLKASSSGAAKDTYSTEVEFTKSSNDLEDMSPGGKLVEDSSTDDVIEKPSISKNFFFPLSAKEIHTSSSNCTDLLAFCKYVKVPTRTRSALTYRGLKVDPLLNNGAENTHHIGSLEGSEVLTEDESIKGSSSGNLLSDNTYDLKNIDSGITKVQSVHSAENVKELGADNNSELDASVRFKSFQDRVYMRGDDQEPNLQLPEYGSCSTMVEERGVKREAEADDAREEAKKMKEWLPSIVPRTEHYFLSSNSIQKKDSSGEDEVSPDDKVIVASDHGSLMSNPQFTQSGDRPFLQCSEEKQPSPSSFRTCDLNLIEASEIHESRDDNPIAIYSSVPETKKVVAPVDVDLSIRQANASGEFNTHATGGKEIEVIDLEDDSAQEEKSVHNVERKTEAMFPCLEGFPSHPQNTADIQDAQDGYGLMISELLGSDFPNCSSVPGDINSVHNEMGLHNGTGALGEDDSIYMSLGEIPLSFLRTWEQPPSQEYEKPF